MKRKVTHLCGASCYFTFLVFSGFAFSTTCATSLSAQATALVASGEPIHPLVQLIAN